ncbi:MAG: hypothetical protein IJU30_05500 [Lachnospiraceae bacterium]|nr:hypothetical protein [Lachnospiraceae bacterium]
MNTKRNYILILGLAAVLCMPLFFACANRALGRSDELHGVAFGTQEEAGNAGGGSGDSTSGDASDSTSGGGIIGMILGSDTAKGLMDGSTQSGWDSLISERIPARATLLKSRNQGIFSVFNQSPNAGVLLCPDGQLMEREYVYKYEKIYPPAAESEVRAQCDKLAAIRDRLRARGKELYLFITPTKPRYYEDSIPESLRKMQAFPDRPGNYEVLKEVLGDYDFEVFDSIAYIDALIRDGSDEVLQFPLYQQTGTHWTWPLGLKVALGFADFLRERSAWSVPMGAEVIGKADAPVFPDADLYDILNIYTPAWGNYFNADIVVDEVAAPDSGTAIKTAEELGGVADGAAVTPDDAENAGRAVAHTGRADMLVRGGSFLGQTISPLINHGFFGHCMYLENTKVYSEDWPNGGTFTSYDELEPALSAQLKETDILILEINEAHVPTMSFGFIDWLYEHPEALD